MDVKAQKLDLIEWLVALKYKSIIEELVKRKEDHQRINMDQYNN